MIYCLINISIPKTSIYNIEDNIFNLKIKDYNINANKLTLELEGEEPLLGTYYIKSEEELQYLQEKLIYGRKVNLTGNLNIPINNTIPNTFNYKKYLENNNIFYLLDIDNIKFENNKISIINKVKNYITNRINNIDNTGYMKAFILGDKSSIDSQTYTNYQNIGVVHLFAISGMHVGLFSAVLLKILKKIKDKIKYPIICIILTIYGYIVAFPSSIKRCIVFFIINTINKLFHLNISSIKILLLTSFIIIMSNYKMIFDVGFLYSITTVGGILLCQNYISSNNKILSSIKLSIIAFLFSLPISLNNFYEINLLSPIYNLFFIPLVSTIIYPLSLLSFIFPILTNIFTISISILENITSFLSSINFFNIYLDFNIIETIIFYFLLYIIFYKNKKIYLILIFLIIIADILLPYLDKNGYIYFFDVGQGDSCLIIGPYRKDIILIDTGGTLSYSYDTWYTKEEYHVSDNIITFLKSISVKSIDQIILSHGDADHAKEVSNIVKKINIKSLKINTGDLSTYEQIALSLISNYNYEPKNIQLSYLNKYDYNDENANSIITFIKIYNTSFLTLGDATKETEEDLINNYDMPTINILKISHHGSNTSSSETYLKNISPEIAIISSGRNNNFGHPSKETLSNLEKLNIKYLNTQTSGTIIFKISPNNVTFEEYPP